MRRDVITLFSLMALLQLSPAPTDKLTGTWLNRDPAAMGITQIVITAENGGLLVYAWGSCVPADCDWGAAKIESKESMPTAVFNQGPITTTLYLVRLPTDKLLVSYKSHYAERPNYDAPDRTEFFERQKPGAEDATARTLLQKVSQTYRDLTAAEFEMEDARQFSDQATAKTSKYTSHVWLGSAGKWRSETSGSGERVVAISDGKFVWTFFPESNQYTVDPDSNTQRPLVDQYGSLDKIRGTTTSAGSERLGNFDCIVVKVERPDSFRTLWIDSKSHFVVKDDSAITSSTPTDSATIHSAVTFSVARVALSADQQLFSFDPNKMQAKPRRELQQQAASSSVGTRAPDFALSDLQSKSVRLSELKGKVVLMDFWATWCIPCRAELPKIELLHRDFAHQGLVVLGVDDEESTDQVAFLNKFGYTFRSLTDPSQQVKNLYKVGGIPTTVLIDREGTIQVFDLGGTSYDTLREAIRKAGAY